MHYYTEAQLIALKKTWNPSQIWQSKNPNQSKFFDLPAGYEPGWFYDTEYRVKPLDKSNP